MGNVQYISFVGSQVKQNHADLGEEILKMHGNNNISLDLSRTEQRVLLQAIEKLDASEELAGQHKQQSALFSVWEKLQSNENKA